MEETDTVSMCYDRARLLVDFNSCCAIVVKPNRPDFRAETIWHRLIQNQFRRKLGERRSFVNWTTPRPNALVNS